MIRPTVKTVNFNGNRRTKSTTTFKRATTTEDYYYEYYHDDKSQDAPNALHSLDNDRNSNSSLTLLEHGT